MLKKFIALALILSLISVFTFTACDKIDVTEIGIPSQERFSTGEKARCVWDIKLWDGKLYVGGGDYSKNTGPTDIWVYDLQDKEWKSSGRVPDEAVARFNVIGGNLIAPGIDPKEDWSVGNYYKLEQGEWVTHRVLPKAIHTFDMIEYKGLIVAGIGNDGGYYPALISYDNGESFSQMNFYKAGELYDITEYEYSRTQELFVFKDNLYAIVYHKLEVKFKLELFEYNNGAFHFVRQANDFCNNNLSLNLLNAKAELNDKFFFSSNYLYVGDNISEFSKVQLPNDEKTSQFKIIDGKLHLLCYKENNEKDGSYTVTMYVSQSGTDDFNEAFSLEYAVPPLCFEKAGDTFYLGMGDKNKTNEKNGAVLEIKI